MADKEEILVRFTVDTASIKNALDRIRKFRDTANQVVGSIQVKLDTKGLISSLASARKRIEAFSKAAAQNAVVRIKVSLDVKSLQAAQKHLNALALTATNLRNKLNGITQTFNKMSAQVATATNKLSYSQNNMAKNVKANATGLLGNLQRAAIATKELALGYEFTTRSFFGFVAAQQIGLRVVTPVIQEFAQFEERLIRVGRLLGLSGQALADFGNRMSAVASQLGVAREALLDLALAAARVGVGKKDIESFVTQTQKIAIALEIPGDQAAETFKSFQLLFKLDTGELTKIANVFNSVADASAVSAQGLAQFLKYLGPVANQFDLIGAKGVSSMTAIGAVLAELGVSAEVTSSGMTKIFTALNTRAEQASRIAGVGFDKFQNMLRDDVLGALELVLTGYSKLDAAQKIAARSALQLTDIRVGRVFNLLSANVDNLRGKMELANRAFVEGVSVEKEVAKNLAGLSSQYQQTKNEVVRIVTEGIQPLVITIKDALFQLREWVKTNPELAKTIASVVTQLAAALAVIGTLSVAAFGILQVLQTIINLGTTLIPIILNLGKAIYYVGITAGNAVTNIRAFVSSLLLSKKLFGTIGPAMSLWFGGVSSAIGSATTALSAFASGFLVFAKGAAIIAAIALAIDALVAVVRGKESLLERTLGKSETIGRIYDSFRVGIQQVLVDMGLLEKAEERIRQRREATEEDTKKAAKATEDMTKAYQKYDEEAKKAVTTQERLKLSIEATTGLAGTLTTALAEGIASDDALTFEQILAQYPSRFQQLAQASAQGGLAVREQLKSWVYLLQTEIPNAGEVTGAEFNRLQKIAQRIAPDQTEFNFTIDTKNAEANLEKFNNALSALSERANNATGEERTKLFKQWAQIAAASLSTAGQSSQKYSARLEELTKVLDGNSDAAEKLFDTFRKLRTGFTVEEAEKFAASLKFLGGTFKQGYSDFQNLTKSVVEFRKELRDEAAIKFGGNMQNLQSVLAGVRNEMDFIRAAAKGGFSGEELAALTELVSRVETRLGLQKQILEIKDEISKAEEKEGAGIQRNIARNIKLLRIIREQARYKSGGVLTREQEAAVEVLEKSIALETEKLNKKKKTEDATRREAKEQAKINEFLNRSVELANKLSDAEEDASAAIEKSRIEEEKALRTAEARADSAEDLVRIRVAGERNIALAVSATARAQVTKAENALKSIQEKIRGLRQSGEDLLARLEGEAEPARKVISDVRNELRPLIEAAEAGKFAGNEDRARVQFELKIQRLREDAQTALQRQALDHIQQRAEAEQKLAELAQRQRGQNISDRQANRTEAQRRSELRQQGMSYDEAEQAIQYERQQRLDERQNLQREIIASEQNYAEVLRSGERFFAGAGPDSALGELGRVFKQLGNEFNAALDFGAQNMADLEEKATQAAEQLTTAANALRDAANALAKIQNAGGQQETARAALGEQIGIQAEAKSKAENLQGISERFTQRFAQHLEKEVTALTAKYSKQNFPVITDNVRQRFQEASDNLQRKFLGMVDNVVQEGGAEEFGDKFKDAISSVFRELSPGVSKLPSAVGSALTELKEEGQKVSDIYAGEAAAADLNIKNLGKSLKTMYEKVADDSAKVTAKIQGVIDASAANTAKQVSAGTGTQAAGATTPTTVGATAPTVGTGSPLEMVIQSARATVDAFEKLTALKKQEIAIQQELLNATAKRKAAGVKAPDAEERRLQTELNIARGYVAIEANVQKQATAASQTTEQFRAVAENAKAAYEAAEAANRERAGFKPFGTEQGAREISKEQIDFESKSAARSMAGLMESTDRAAQKVNTFSTEVDNVLGDKPLTSTAPVEAESTFKSLDQLDALIAELRLKDQPVVTPTTTSPIPVESVTPLEEPAVPPAAPDEIAAETAMAELKFALESVGISAKAASEELKGIAANAGKLPTTDDTGGVSADAVENATEELGALDDAQEEEVAAVGGLAETVSSYAVASAERLTSLTQKANAATADSAAALAILQQESLA